MNFEFHTMTLMFCALTFLLSGFLALSALYAPSIRGIWLWAAASLSYCLASLVITMSANIAEDRWRIVFLAVSVFTGVSLQFSGIQAFQRKPISRTIPLLIVVIGLAQGTIFAVLFPNSAGLVRAIGNSIVFALANALCARALLIPVDKPLRTAYWFTGGSFAVLSAVSLGRALIIYFSHTDILSTRPAQLPFDPRRFFVTGLLQICVTFGFILMMNCRLVMDAQEMAIRDGLTGALNRRSLEDEMTRLTAHCARTGDNLAVIMLDIDHFKLINDRFGHQAGDKVLQGLASLTKSTIRNEDYFARYGGDEFCIVMPSATEFEAHILAERLCRTFASRATDFCPENLQSTISIGIADSTRIGVDFRALMAAADMALYGAKKDGRNRITSHSALQGYVHGNQAEIMTASKTAVSTSA